MAKELESFAFLVRNKTYSAKILRAASRSRSDVIVHVRGVTLDIVQLDAGCEATRTHAMHPN
jgi:hypothetical protein